MKKIIQYAVILIIALMVNAMLFGQFGREYAGPTDPAGDPAFEREGRMTGNRAFTLFKNNTELSDHPRQDVSRWPDTYYGNINVPFILEQY